VILKSYYYFCKQN